MDGMVVLAQTCVLISLKIWQISKNQPQETLTCWTGWIRGAPGFVLDTLSAPGLELRLVVLAV